MSVSQRESFHTSGLNFTGACGHTRVNFVGLTTLILFGIFVFPGWTTMPAIHTFQQSHKRPQSIFQAGVNSHVYSVFEHGHHPVNLFLKQKGGMLEH